MTKIFLDLEGTVIDTWDNMNLSHSNITKIRQDICSNEFELNIFSFAIYNDEDVDKFKFRLKDILEEQFNHYINIVPSVEKIMRDIQKERKCQLEFGDMFSIFKKDLAFQLYCKHNFKDCTCILFDDMVESASISYFDKNLNVQLIKI